MTRAQPFGLYLHIPFCAHRCDYCAFATWTDRAHLVDRYLAACRRHLDELVAAGLPAATSVFVGGGTPSLVAPDALAEILAAVPLVAGAEMTVECNPDTVTTALVATYRAAGVNRISLGVQSLVPRVLRALGRTHDPDHVRTATEAVRAGGIDSLNIDLIYGVAGETSADWRRTVDGALALDPTHISAYGLTVEPGTALADDPARHPDDDDQADKYLFATDRLAEAGFEWYEISNWGQPGERCRHNLLYWSGGEYQGVGCAAHSHRDGRRSWHVRTPERYVAAIEEGRGAEAGDERLAPDERRLEALQLSLRTAAGVPAESLSLDDLDDLAGLVELSGDRAVLTVRGRLLANEVALRLRSGATPDASYHSSGHEETEPPRQ